jgi:hypothetical protein
MRIQAAAALLALVWATTSYAEIQDNSFFIEEAYNQDAHVVQNIQTFVWTEDREEGLFDQALTFAFTQEWPLGGQRNQLSYTFAFARLYGDNGDAEGIGDVQLHYRYQLLEETSGRPAFAPRLTLILPTGNADEGLGAGTLGVQTNLPLSKQLDHASVHLNAGATFLPGVKVPLAAGGQSSPQDLFFTNFGFSVIPVLSDRFNLLFETTAAVNEEITDAGEREQVSRVLFSPGARYAIDRQDGGQWVLGAAAPIGVSLPENDFGLLLYLSYENSF